MIPALVAGPGLLARALARRSDPLSRCLFLAALLHVLLVLWFGNAPGGSAGQGEGVFGALNITLTGPGTGPPAPPQPTPQPGGPVGQAKAPRWGGAVRTQTNPPDPNATAGAARLGAWQASAQFDLPPARPALEPARLAAPEPDPPWHRPSDAPQPSAETTRRLPPDTVAATSATVQASTLLAPPVQLPPPVAIPTPVTRTAAPWPRCQH